MSFPQRREASASGTADGTNPVVLDLGAPASGNQWDVRRVIVVDGGNPTTAHTTGITVFVVTPHGGAQNLFQPSEIADVTACGIPAAASWSRGTIVLMPLERIELWIYGLSASTKVIGTMQAEESHPA